MYKWLKISNNVEHMLCIQDVFLEVNMVHERDETRKKGSITSCVELLNRSNNLLQLVYYPLRSTVNRTRYSVYLNHAQKKTAGNSVGVFWFQKSTNLLNP